MAATSSCWPLSASADASWEKPVPHETNGSCSLEAISMYSGLARVKPTR